MATMTVKDADGVEVDVEKPLAPGQTTMANSRPVVIASDQSAVPVSGTVGVSGSVAVTGTFYQATQPVSGTVGISGTVPVSGTFWQATQPVSGTVAATQSGTWNVTNISGTVSLPTGAATAANQSTANTALSAIQTAVEALETTVSGSELQVDVLTSTLPTGAATSEKQDTMITHLATLATADPAHDAADTGSPVKIGGKAKTSLSGETLVAADDRVNANFSRDGAQFVRTVPLGDIVSGVAGITDGSSTSVIAAQGSGIKTYVTGVVIANSSATAVTVDIRDGAAGTVKATFPVPANTAGVVFNYGDTPLPFSANTAICADPSAAASTVTVSLVGFKSAI